MYLEKIRGWGLTAPMSCFTILPVNSFFLTALPAPLNPNLQLLTHAGLSGSTVNTFLATEHNFTRQSIYFKKWAEALGLGSRRWMKKRWSHGKNKLGVVSWQLGMMSGEHQPCRSNINVHRKTQARMCRIARFRAWTVLTALPSATGFAINPASLGILSCTWASNMVKRKEVRACSCGYPALHRVPALLRARN